MPGFITDRERAKTAVQSERVEPVSAGSSSIMTQEWKNASVKYKDGRRPSASSLPPTNLQASRRNNLVPALF